MLTYMQNDPQKHTWSKMLKTIVIGADIFSKVQFILAAITADRISPPLSFTDEKRTSDWNIVIATLWVSIAAVQSFNSCWGRWIVAIEPSIVELSLFGPKSTIMLHLVLFVSLSSNCTCLALNFFSWSSVALTSTRATPYDWYTYFVTVLSPLRSLSRLVVNTKCSRLFNTLNWV